MLFNSLLFVLFFIIVTGTYYLLPGRFRWIWLLLASCYFYMYFKPAYLLIILFTIVVDYLAGILIEGATGPRRRLFLLLSIAANAGVLIFYKYFDFVAENINGLTGFFEGPQIPLLHILLPIGLSFHTFQAMSYTIEVYRGNQKAERHFGLYALYVLFYPQMVAGPIERPQHILPQLHRTHRFSTNTFLTGILLMAIGFFKKVVIADRLGLYVDPVFSNPAHHTSLSLLLAAYFFAFQIYCDFSGYSDIAVGTALTLGIKLMANFNMPYLAQNVAEFWSKWHISLSTWFRDYIYIPLGGNRVSLAATAGNVMLVFALSGLWHGADWKYLIWGLIHGALLILYRLAKKFKITPRLSPVFKWLATFNLVCLAWVFFRADTASAALYIVKKIILGHTFTYSASGIMSGNEIAFCGLIITALLAGEWCLKKRESLSAMQKVSITLLLTALCYFLGIFNEAQFIYFQF